MSFKIGQLVKVKDDSGVIKFIGTTSFAPGTWFGIELQHPRGKNNGSVQGVKYFDCKQDSDGGFYGVFVRESMLNHGDVTSDKDASQLNQIILKLQAKLKAASNESAEYRNNFMALQSNFEKKLEIISDLQAKLEMQNVNNDFLQVVKQELEDKIQEWSTKYNELSKEFELVKEELEVTREIEKEIELANVDEFTSRDIQIIVERNRQMEGTVALLTERSETTEKKLREELNDLQKRITNNEEVEKKLTKAESTILILQERIDTFADMEKMVERLTVENDELNSKIKNLSTTINEFHEIQELDRNLEEDMRQIESGLREEIESYKSLIHEYELKINQLEKAATKQKQEVELQSSGNSSLRTDEAELNALKQTITDLKIKSRSDSVQLKLIKNRYEVLLRRRITNADVSFGKLMGLIVSLKIYNLDLVTLNQTLLGNNLHLKVVSIFLIYSSEFFQLLVTILECNYSTNNIDSIISEITTELDKLTLVFEKVNTILLSDDLSQGVSPELQQNLGNIYLFIEKCVAVLDIGFHSSDFVFETRECFRFMMSSNKLKNAFLENVCVYVKSRLDDTQMNFMDTIDSIVMMNEEFKTKSHQLCQKYDLSENIEFTSQSINFAQQIQISSILSVYQLVSDDNFEVTSNLIEELENLSALMNIDYDFQVEKPAVSVSTVYEYRPVVESSNGHNNSEALNELQDVIAQREREINDLRLNINLLEQNMLSLASQSSSKVTELNQMLKSLKAQEETHLDLIGKLQQEKKDLLKELDIVEKNSSKTIEFENLQSQKEYNEKVSIIEKITHLKNIAKRNDSSEDYSWLEDNYNTKKIWNDSTPLQQLSRDLRDLAMDIKPVLVNPTNKFVWKKLTQQPTFINLIIEERYAKYNSIKSNLFEDQLK